MTSKAKSGPYYSSRKISEANKELPVITFSSFGESSKYHVHY